MCSGMTLIDSYAGRERSYARNFYNGDHPDALRSGTGPGHFMFTAPHASNYLQDGRRRFAEPYTGALAETLGDLTGGSWAASAGIASEWEYWEERRDAFSEAVRQGVSDGHFIVDLNGLSPRYGADMFIGLGTTPSQEALDLADAIVYEFSEYQVVAGGKLNATSPRTVRSFVASQGGDAIQLELVPRLINVADHPFGPEDFITRLSGLLGAHAASRLALESAAA